MALVYVVPSAGLEKCSGGLWSCESMSCRLTCNEALRELSLSPAGAGRRGERQ